MSLNFVGSQTARFFVSITHTHRERITHIRALAENYKSEKRMQLTEPKRFEQLLFSIYEATEFVAIFRGLESYKHESLILKLKEMASGPIRGTD